MYPITIHIDTTPIGASYIRDESIIWWPCETFYFEDIYQVNNFKQFISLMYPILIHIDTTPIGTYYINDESIILRPCETFYFEDIYQVNNFNLQNMYRVIKCLKLHLMITIQKEVHREFWTLCIIA
jgi:hypothetical protein